MLHRPRAREITPFHEMGQATLCSVDDEYTVVTLDCGPYSESWIPQAKGVGGSLERPTTDVLSAVPTDPEVRLLPDRMKGPFDAGGCPVGG